MRCLDKEFEDKFENEFKFVIDFVKKSDDVFLGIRDNLVDLYVSGGCFFTLELSKAYSYIRNNSIYNELSHENQQLLNEINNKFLNEETIRKWKILLPILKNTEANHFKKSDRTNGIKMTYKEKIVQQKIALSLNRESNYFNYDIEYNIKGLNDYYYLIDGTPDKDNESLQKPGRIDNIAIKIKKNKVYFYLIEIKEGENAITPMNNKTKLYGSGVIGHINSYMQLLDYTKNNLTYISKYREEDENKISQFNFRDYFMQEMRFTMNFYKKYGLITNPKYKEIDYESLEFGDIEFVLYLSGYNHENKKFEEHLGLIGNYCVSVKNLINRDYKEMKYMYITKEQLYDFKVHKDEKTYDDEERLNESDLDIDGYQTIKNHIKNGKVVFEEIGV